MLVSIAEKSTEMCVFLLAGLPGRAVLVLVHASHLGIVTVVAIANVQTVRGSGHRETQTTIVQLGHFVFLHFFVLALRGERKKMKIFALI